MDVVDGSEVEYRCQRDGVQLVDALVDQLLESSSASIIEFRGRQYDLGLAWVHFPVGEGGLALPRELQTHLDARLARAGVGQTDARQFFGLTMAGPTLVAHGDRALKDRLLRRMFTGEDIWCQLFSEPNAGSDLAGLASRGVRDGDEWVVNGQKVWNTLAHVAQRGMLVVRTDRDVPKHRGLTFFAIDMTSPGVEVRPLRQLTGEAEFNEVYLDDVRIPDADRVGDIDDGWRVALTTLANERMSIGGAEAPSRGSGAIDEAMRIWADEALLHHPVKRDELVRLWIDAEVLRLTNLRSAELAASGNPGPEGSIAKIMFADVNMRIYEFCVGLLGARALAGFDYTMVRPDSPELIGPPGSSRKMFLRSRANSIEGGTSEVQRNIIGERVLGLPAEPKIDKNRAWSDVSAGTSRS